MSGPRGLCLRPSHACNHHASMGCPTTGPGILQALFTAHTSSGAWAAAMPSWAGAWPPDLCPASNILAQMDRTGRSDEEKVSTRIPEAPLSLTGGAGRSRAHSSGEEAPEVFSTCPVPSPGSCPDHGALPVPQPRAVNCPRTRGVSTPPSQTPPSPVRALEAHIWEGRSEGRAGGHIPYLTGLWAKLGRAPSGVGVIGIRAGKACRPPSPGPAAALHHPRPVPARLMLSLEGTRLPLGERGVSDPGCPGESGHLEPEIRTLEILGHSETFGHAS